MVEGIFYMRKKFEDHGWLLYNCLFIGIVFCGYYPLFRHKISLIYYVDGVGQYYPAFIYIGQYLQDFFRNLFHGNFSLPFYDLSIGMGEDIIGTLNYYGFGDPLNLLAVFVSKSNSAYLFTLMFFLRIWLSGIAFQHYCLFMRMDRLGAILGALCYSFSGFAISGGAMCIEWLAVLMYFPLILTGIEKIFSKAKPYMLIFSVAYAAVCGFYYLYMVSLVLVVYCITRLLTILGVRNIRFILRKCFICVGWYLVGVCLAAPFLIPALAAYMNSERSDFNIMDIVLNIRMYIPTLNYDFIRIIFHFFHSRINYLSGITLVQIIAVLFLFLLPKCKRGLQLQLAVIISLIALHVPITGWLFNAFAETNDRWVFAIHFTVSIVLVYVFQSYEGVEIIINSLRTIKVKRRMVHAGVVVFTILNIVGNIWLLYLSIGDDWKQELISFNNYSDYIDSPVNYSEVLQQDKDIFRVSNDSLTGVNGRPENVAMLNNYYGLTYWFSIANKNTQTFINEVTNNKHLWRSYGVYNNPILETASGVKYYLGKKGGYNPGRYELLEEMVFNGEIWQVYRNPDYLGMAYIRNSAESAKLWNDKQSYDEYFDAVLRLRSNQEQINFDYDKQTGIVSCTVYTEQDSELVVLIPYSGNWKAYVDGNKADVCKTDIMYISIPIEEQGMHEVIITYSPIEFKVGIGLMFISIIIITGRIFYIFYNLPYKH